MVHRVDADDRVERRIRERQRILRVVKHERRLLGEAALAGGCGRRLDPSFVDVNPD
jgi:hypothetical protein